MVNKIDFTQNIINFKSIDSTNDFLKREYENLPNYTVIVSDYQTSGKGQFDRVWESNDSENLLCSILVKDDTYITRKMMNPLIVTSIISTLSKFGLIATYKAPNDIYIGDNKIAGVLIETKYEGSNVQYTIVGMGLNVNQTNFKTFNATSMKKESGKTYDIQSILKKLLDNISKHFALLSLKEVQ
jgi:BirA family biotin operon repressor/biotin-[acetyl-CoA-carboxylase] ligase